MSQSSRVFSSPVATRGLMRLAFMCLAVSIAIALAFNVSGCANIERARAAATKQGELCRGDQADERLPESTRQLAQDDADTFEVIRWSLGGDAPSSEAQARINKRRAARDEEPLNFK